MTENERIGFDMGCAIGFDMDSFDVDAMFERYGLDTHKNSLQECQVALRKRVGEARWVNGIKLIQSRTREPRARDS